MIDPALLRHHPLLRACAPAALALLAQHAVHRRYARGETLFRAGEKSRGLILLLKGRVRVVRVTGDRGRVVHFEDEGGTLGEVPLYDGKGYPAMATAERETTIAVIDRDALSGALRIDPGLAWGLLGRMAHRVRTLVDRIEALSADSVRHRLMQWIRQHADKEGRIHLTQTQAELAVELGTAREVLVRELGRMRRAGQLQVKGRREWRLLD